MGSSDGTPGRHLRLERETLRDLAPTPTDAAEVRGGGPDDSRTSPDGLKCLPAMPDSVRRLLGSTMTSYGCRGMVKIEQTETGQEIHIDLRPNEATQEMHEIAKLEATARMPDLSGKLEELGRQHKI